MYECTVILTAFHHNSHNNKNRSDIQEVSIIRFYRTALNAGRSMCEKGADPSIK